MKTKLFSSATVRRLQALIALRRFALGVVTGLVLGASLLANFMLSYRAGLYHAEW